MASDTKYLEWHGRQWRVQVKVPPSVRPIIGTARLVRGLKTDSLSRAQKLRYAIVAEFHQRIEDAKKQLDLAGGSAATSLALEGSEYLAALQHAQRHPHEDAEYNERGEMIVDGVMLVQSLIRGRTLELAESRGAKDATTFHQLAQGTATPLTLHVESWLSESTMKVRQKTDYKRAVMKLDKWIHCKEGRSIIQIVTPRLAGEYVSKGLLARGTNRRTINKDVSCLSSYWRWMKKKDLAEFNPWEGQSVAELSRPRSESQRPFRSDEMRKLFEGNPPALLHDFMRVAALSGMRIGEIAALQVRDTYDETFHIRKSKTKAGERSLPIHSELVSLVERRRAGKGPTDLLFSDLPSYDPSKPQEQASPVTKAFVRYRRKVGVDEVLEGSRRSLVDFHSFRRWFVTEADRALIEGATGYSRYTIADVVGHAKKSMDLGMTMGVYAGTADAKAKRACVQAVRLNQA